jgi:monoamine oxidase
MKLTNQLLQIATKLAGSDGPKVVIVGAGFSGLAIAWHLGQLGFNVTVLEASPRFGGRIETGKFSTGDSYEHGAAEFYDITGDSHLKDLVKFLDLDTRPMKATPYFVWRDKTLETKQAIRREIGDSAVDAMDEFWQLGLYYRSVKDFSNASSLKDNKHPWIRNTYESVLEKYLPNELGRAFTLMQGHSDLAAAPDRVNGTFGFDNLLIDDPAYCKFYLIKGGNDLLVKTLMCGNFDVVFDASVRRIASTVNGFKVFYNGKSIDADAVVITTSPVAMDYYEFTDEDLAIATQAHSKRYSKMTNYLRVSFLFQDRFWAKDFPEDYFVHDCFKGATVYDQSWMNSGRGVLSWLLAGSEAADLSALNDSDVIRAVIDQFPPAIKRKVHRGIDARVDRYMNGVSRQPGGLPLLPYLQRHKPCEDKALYFTGDYLYDATINGAYESACRVVDYIAKTYGKAIVHAGQLQVP